MTIEPRAADLGRVFGPTRRTFVCGAVASLGTVLTAQAQDYPARTITMIVPFPPGGSPDILARHLGRKLSESLGKPVVIENRGGAGGTIGAEAAARAPADGYTLLMGHIGTLAFNPSIYPNLRYEPLRSFAPVSMVASVTNLLAVNPSIPATNVRELIDHAKANPGRLHYASGGNGSAAHIAMAAFADTARIEMVHVPYRGTAPAVTDVIAGHVHLTLTGATALLGHVRTGKVRPLGVAGLKRLASEPEIPAIAETLPGFEANQWYGVVAPAGTPDPIVQRLNREIHAAMASPEIIEALARDGAEVFVTSPAEFHAYIGKEIPRWGEVIKRANIQPE